MKHSRLRRSFHSRHAFTLVELLIVIGIIALLVGILLPTLGRARESARAVACASLLRQYALASEMYIIENDGWTVDSYNHLNYEDGLTRYMGEDVMPDEFARCPDDGVTEDLGRLGVFEQTDFSGVTTSVKVSIGCNENTTSASARPTSVGPRAIWVRRSFFVGYDPTKSMIWADWQNNPYQEDPGEAVVKPGSTGMGSLVFRHLGTSNTAFMDGHVGKLRPTVALLGGGHELDDGTGQPGNWPLPPGSAGPIGKIYKTYYPFGPGRTPSGYTVNGDWPTIEIE